MEKSSDRRAESHKSGGGRALERIPGAFSNNSPPFSGAVAVAQGGGRKNLNSLVYLISIAAVAPLPYRESGFLCRHRRLHGDAFDLSRGSAGRPRAFSLSSPPSGLLIRGVLPPLSPSRSGVDIAPRPTGSLPFPPHYAHRTPLIFCYLRLLLISWLKSQMCGT